MEERSQTSSQRTERILLDVITALRKNPAKYRKMQKALREANSDEARVKQLLHFATSDRQLAALIPVSTGGAQELAWTTVTVTTVFIPATAH